MKRLQITAWIASTLLMLTHPALANKGTINFDCDVPPDHYSSVSQDVTSQLMISGSVEMVEKRSGSYLPMAGARLISADGKNSIEFRIVAAASHPKQFDLTLKTKRDGQKSDTKTIGQVDIGKAISFNLALSELGEAKLSISGANFKTDFVPISEGREIAFCSTGQFKFSDLAFVANDQQAAQ